MIGLLCAALREMSCSLYRFLTANKVAVLRSVDLLYCVGKIVLLKLLCD